MSYSSLSEMFADIAESIRDKTGESGTIKAEDFASIIGGTFPLIGNQINFIGSNSETNIYQNQTRTIYYSSLGNSSNLIIHFATYEEDYVHHDDCFILCTKKGLYNLIRPNEYTDDYDDLMDVVVSQQPNGDGSVNVTFKHTVDYYSKLVINFE